jgi:hypothetical protein
VFSFPWCVIGEADTRFALHGVWWHFSVRHLAFKEIGRSLTQLLWQM